MLEQVTTYEPRPLRQYDERLPKELERICYKSLAKRASERYSSAHDMVDDLRHFLMEQTFIDPTSPLGAGTGETVAAESAILQSAPSSRGSSASRSASIGLVSSGRPPVKIVPKGLRSFDSHDSDFFLELLPGPRDREGLPDSLRFWKTRIEDFDVDNTFSVGLIYGPSGCGKSSFVKAGLLPRLSEDVVPIYIEATPEETETRLLHGLRKRCPALDGGLGLKETVTALRQGQGIPPGKKILIVLDQFEQWLHAKKDEDNTELVKTLRQCDGGRVQCIVMVRDDFWLAVSRFLRDLEVRLVEGHNIALADLFDLDHARRVLAAFGRAFGKLPENVYETTKQQKQFLSQAVAGLAEEGKVICVRLALFAEMMKGKPWTQATFKEVGGTQGIGVTFLEETFSSSAASPEHRYHQKAARSVLQELLPESGTDIKGFMRSYSELLKVSGLTARPGEFDDLIRILDSEVRLITPTDPEGFESEVESRNKQASGEKYFQLAHDYLVHSLRDWLFRKQKETRRGRAELLLADRSTIWNSNPEDRFLPSWRENLAIRMLTEKKNWSQLQSKMMARSGRFHAIRTSLAGLVLALLIASGFVIRNAAINRQREVEATRLVQGLLQADTSQVKTIIDTMADYRRWSDDKLAAAFASSADESNAKLHAALARSQFDPAAQAYLESRLLTVSPLQFEFVCELLGDHAEDWVGDFWNSATDESLDPAERFQAACVLANYDSKNEKWNDPQFADFVVRHLVGVLPSHLLPWRNALRPVRHDLTNGLATVFRDPDAGEQVRSFATDTLCDYLRNDPDALFDLLADADQKQFGPLFDRLAIHQERAIELGNTEVLKPLPVDASESEKEALAIRQANSAVMLYRLDSEESVWPLLRFRPDPRVRSYVIHWLKPRGANPTKLVQRFERETDVTVKRALLLAIGEFKPTQLSDVSPDSLVQKLLLVYRNEPDAGLHAAAEWLLRTWGQADAIADVDQELAMPDGERMKAGSDGKNWFINRSGHSFVILDAGEIKLGSPPDEPNHYINETFRVRRINRRLAFSAKHVTKGQWRNFCTSQEQEYSADKESLQSYLPTDESPMIAITWFEAASYCNWLSGQEGIPEEQWCFEPNEDGEFGPGMKAKDNFLELAGYRLATEAEWEYSCRAETRTSRYFGLSVDLLPCYAWFAANNENFTRPVGTRKPNDFGLFDMHGNVFDWCYDMVDDEQDEVQLNDDSPVTEPVTATGNRILRGGSFVVPEANVRSAARYFNQPSTRRLGTGFRIVRSMPR